MCSVCCPKKKIKQCSASKMTFRASFYRTDPHNIGGQFGKLSRFLRNTFESEQAKKSPEIYFGLKSFRTIFEKRTPVYSLAASLLGLAKSIYYLLIRKLKDLESAIIQGSRKPGNLEGVGFIPL